MCCCLLTDRTNAGLNLPDLPVILPKMGFYYKISKAGDKIQFVNEGDKVNCNYCEFRCDISRSPGVCGRYVILDGQVVEKEPFFWLPTNTSDMESMPFFHAMPGEYVLHVGTVDCNVGCDYCINAHVVIDCVPEEALDKSRSTAASDK